MCRGGGGGVFLTPLFPQSHALVPTHKIFALFLAGFRAVAVVILKADCSRRAAWIAKSWDIHKQERDDITTKYPELRERNREMSSK